jgi:phosphonate transport system permease protein
MAITLTYTGMIGKVFLEIYESQDTRAAEALFANGAGRLQAFFYGTLPACLPELMSYTVYRWECAIRSSVILGFVGAGGLGQQMELSMRMLSGGEVLSFLLAFMALVWLADRISQGLRVWID